MEMKGMDERIGAEAEAEVEVEVEVERAAVLAANATKLPNLLLRRHRHFGFVCRRCH